MSHNRPINVRFVLRGFTVAVAIVLMALPCALGALFMAGLTAPVCGGSTMPPFPHEDVFFTSSEFNLSTRAYFIPTDVEPARGVLIALPTGARGRGDRMSEIAIYRALGYHVLSYESRMCVAGAVNTLGWSEAGQVADALAYLRTRAELEGLLIGLHGFSAGGASALFAAARHPEIAFVVAQGNYADFRAEIDDNTPQLGILGGLFRFGALTMYRLNTGLDVDVLRPLDAVPQIAPRRVLLIYGSREPGLQSGRRMEAAGNHIELWVIDGAGHGDYVAVAGEAYAIRLEMFLGH